MDPMSMQVVLDRQHAIIDARLRYAALSPSDKLALAERGIYSEKDYADRLRN